MFKRILVASDLADQSATALSLARQLGVETGAWIIALHVLAMPEALRPLAGPKFLADVAAYRKVLERQVAAAKERLEACIDKSGLNRTFTRCMVRTGAPASVIANVADELDADLIIVGRGRDGRLGPVAEHTVRLVGRTVMVAPVRRKRRAKKRLPTSIRQPRRVAA